MMAHAKGVNVDTRKQPDQAASSYITELSPQERADAIKTGMVFGIALQSNSVAEMQKRAQAVPAIVGGLRMALTTALLLGIPLGSAWHMIDRNSSARRRTERELRERLKFYKDVASGVEDELADDNELKVVTSI